MARNFKSSFKGPGRKQSGIGIGGRSSKVQFSSRQARRSGGLSGSMKSVMPKGMSGSSGSIQFMPGVKLSITTKFKLNDPYWTRTIGRARSAGMRAQGALLRYHMRSSIKFNRKEIHTPYGPQFKPSPVGKPPRSHTRNRVASIRNIQYDYNPSTDGLIVGAVFLKRTYSTTVPGVHEHGKTVSVEKIVPVKPKKIGGRTHARAATQKQADAWKKKAKQNHPKFRAYKAKLKIHYKKIREPITFPKRPFARPALDTLTKNGALIRRFGKVFNQKL